MDPKTGSAPAAQQASMASDIAVQDADRRLDSDRRTYSDRRRYGGLFEVRARRDGSDSDRRRRDRRDRGRSWLNFWRRDG